MANIALPRSAALLVTIQTPAHIERSLLADSLHFLHLAMAILAGNAFKDVPLMREVNVVGERMYTDPENRFFLLKRGQHLLDFGVLRFHNAVALVTCADRGNSGGCRARCARMAIQAGDLIIAGVNAVAEIDGLNRCFGTSFCLEHSAQSRGGDSNYENYESEI
jgi:hypothetical protein